MNGNRVESRRAGWAFGGQHNDDSIASNIFCGITLEHEPNAFVPQATVDGALINQPVGSNHSGGLQIAMVDASTRFISEDVNLASSRLRPELQTGKTTSLNSRLCPNTAVPL